MVDKEVLTDKQNEGGYFMYSALNVRAPPPPERPRDSIRTLPSKIYFFIGLKKRNRFVKRHIRKLPKNYITRLQGE